MKTLHVHLDERSYPIHISSEGWGSLPTALNKIVEGKKVLVITDSNVFPLYYDAVRQALLQLHCEIHAAVIQPGEKSKSLSAAEDLYTQCLEARLDRSSVIAALGGGVIGDLAGFIAATYMRGIPFVQIPTTLLAQVDSSVGGKVAVNHTLAKNIIGAFYQPKAVFINTKSLHTLPRREFSTGMAELIKHGFISGSPKFLNWLEQHMESLMAQDSEAMAQAVYQSCEIKSRVVEQDERESGLRAILNFGHTIGHAVEAATEYELYNHGEAVALGMVYESLIALERGLVDQSFVNHMVRILIQAGLPVSLPDLDSHLLMNLMTHDKKNTGGQIVFVLPTGTGRVSVYNDIPDSTVQKALQRRLSL